MWNLCGLYSLPVCQYRLNVDFVFSSVTLVCFFVSHFYQGSYAEWNGRCLECSSPHPRQIVFVLLGMFGVALFTHFLSQGTPSTMEMLFFTIQTTSIIMYPQSLLLTASHVVNFFPAVPGDAEDGCPFYVDGIEQLVVRLFSPIVYYSFLWLWWLLHVAVVGLVCKLYSTGRSESGLGGKRERILRWLIKTSHVDNYVLSSVILGIGVYDGFSQTTLQFFMCSDVGSSQYLLFSPSVECYTDDWYRWLPLFIFCLVLVVAVPIAIAVFTLSLRRRGILDNKRVCVSVSLS